MRKIYLTLITSLLCLGGFAQTQDLEIHTDFLAPWGNISAVDLTNKGTYDLFIAGRERTDIERGTILSYNQSSQKFEVVDTTWKVCERANLDWADVDGDGLVDVIAASHIFTDTVGVFKNLGNYKFQHLDWPVPSHTDAVAFSDFNRDGLIDYFCLSQDTLSQVYLNNGDGTFTSVQEDMFGQYAYGLGYAKAIDINNDGLSDIYVSGNVDSRRLGNEDTARVHAEIYLNNPDQPGTFYPLGLGTLGVKMKANGGIDFNDVDGDGWLDMFIVGEGGSGTGEPLPTEDIWACIPHLYKNNKDNTFTEIGQIAKGVLSDIRPLNSTGQGARFIDWDNDGNMDLFVLGWNPPAAGGATQRGYYLHGDGNGNFKDTVVVPGGSEAELGFIDWNHDGVLDYVYSGESWDAKYFSDAEGTTGRHLVIMTNPTTTLNDRPGAPTNLQVSQNGIQTVLSWDAGTDSKTPSKSLSYEYFLKKDGAYMTAPASFVGGANDGVRKVLQIGNADLNKSVYFLNLADGDYVFGVQSIDNSYEGSPFDSASFTISGGSLVTAVNQTELNKFDIYLDPLNNILRVSNGMASDITIYSIEGRKIKSIKNATSLNVHELIQGIYIVKAKQNNYQITRKVVKK
jgi:hypothetical protein